MIVKFKDYIPVHALRSKSAFVDTVLDTPSNAYYFSIFAPMSIPEPLLPFRRISHSIAHFTP